MFSLIEAWRASGKTQRDFCLEKDIAYGKFHYWLKRYRGHDSTTATRSGFVTVEVNDHLAAGSGALELIYPDGRRLIFYKHVDPSFLRTLLS